MHKRVSVINSIIMNLPFPHHYSCVTFGTAYNIAHSCVLFAICSNCGTAARRLATSTPSINLGERALVIARVPGTCVETPIRRSPAVLVWGGIDATHKLDDESNNWTVTAVEDLKGSTEGCAPGE